MPRMWFRIRKPAPSESVSTMRPRVSARVFNKRRLAASLKMPKPEVSKIAASTTWLRVFLS